MPLICSHALNQLKKTRHFHYKGQEELVVALLFMQDLQSIYVRFTRYLLKIYRVFM